MEFREVKDVGLGIEKAIWSNDVYASSRPQQEHKMVDVPMLCPWNHIMKGHNESHGNVPG